MGLSSTLSENILDAAYSVWEYMHVNHQLEKCDLAIAMGSHDLRTAGYAAALIEQGWAPLLICSGASGRLTQGKWEQSEAQLFADEAVKAGIDRKLILLEDQSTNTAENLTYCADLLRKKQIPYSRVLLIHKPYMERRVLATAAVVWPQTPVVITSPPIPMCAYPTEDIPMEEVIAIMTGDFQRIIEYPKRGYSIPQQIPEKVLKAFAQLKNHGFTGHLL